MLLVPGGFEGLDRMKEVGAVSKQEGLTVCPEIICFLVYFVGYSR